MKSLIASIAAIGFFGAAQADDKKHDPSMPTIMMSGKIAGQIYMKSQNGKPSKETKVVLFELKDRSMLAVASPPGQEEAKSATKKNDAVDPDLAKLLSSIDSTIAVEGRLSSTADSLVIAAARAKDSKRIPLLIANRSTDITDMNRNKFPPVNSVRIEWTLMRSEFKLGPKPTEWAIQQVEQGHIPLIVTEEKKVPATGTRVYAAGNARLIDGRFVVEVKELEAVKKE